MVYFIIFIIIAMVVAPIFWMMPSPGQKRQILLRQRAIALGLQVKVCDLPQSHRAKVRKELPKQGVVYRLMWHQDNDSENAYTFCQRAQPMEERDQSPSPITVVLYEALENMIEQVVAIEYSRSGIAIYWSEQGSVELVEQIAQQLHDVKQAIIAFNNMASLETD